MQTKFELSDKNSVYKSFIANNPPKKDWEHQPTKVLHNASDRISNLLNTGYSKLKGRVLRVEYVTFSCSLIKGIRFVLSAVADFLPLAPNPQALSSLKFVSGVNIPIALYQMSENIVKVAKGTLNEKIDVFLDTTFNLGLIGDSISGVGSALEGVGLVAAKSMMWATPLAIVSVSLEVAGIVLNIKESVENFIFRGQLSKEAGLDKTVEHYGVEDYRKGFDFLVQQRTRERSFLNKHFRVNDKKLLNRLRDIESEAREKIQSANSFLVNEGKSLLHNTMSALKRRVTTRMISNTLAILSGVTSIVGLFIILFTPIAPLGYAFLAIGVVLGIAKVAFDYETTRRFENELQLNGKGVHRDFFPLPSWVVNWHKKKKQIKKMETPAETHDSRHAFDQKHTVTPGLITMNVPKKMQESPNKEMRQSEVSEDTIYGKFASELSRTASDFSRKYRGTPQASKESPQNRSLASENLAFQIAEAI